MTRATTRAGLIAAGLCLSALAAGPVSACDTPVFRYALERWPPDLYETIVFHRQALLPAEKKLTDAFAEKSADEDAPANMVVRAVDVSAEMDAFSAAIWKQCTTDKLPLVAVCYPRWTGRAFIAWSSPLSDSAVKIATDSPVRRQVVKHLVGGATAVWVLLECGDKKKDEQAAKTVQAHLKKLQDELELPVRQPPMGPFADEEPPGPPLKIEFPIVRLSRKDAAEAAFIKMLVRTEDDLEDEYSGEPMTFPIFGRGRALFALVGKGIRQDNIEDACIFLIGRCSCQVKQQNPGVDMLMAADWEAAFEEVQYAAPQLPSVIAAPTTEPTTAPTTAPAAAPSDPQAASSDVSGASAQAAEPLSVVGRLLAGGRGSLIRNGLIALGVVVLAVVLLVLRVNRRPARS